MHFTGGNDKIFRSLVLQDQPHTFHVIFGISPVTAGIQISQIQLVLESLFDTGSSQGDFAGHESLSAPFTLVVEQDTVHGKHPVALAVILGNPESVLLGHSVRRTRIERCRFLLRNFLHLSEQFRGRSLIYPASLFQTADTHSLQQAECSHSIRFSRIFRHVE